jgi:hypothetical protein
MDAVRVSRLGGIALHPQQGLLGGQCAEPTAGAAAHRAAAGFMAASPVAASLPRRLNANGQLTTAALSGPADITLTR